MNQNKREMSLRTAALVAGVGYILMMGTPIAENAVYHKLVSLASPHETTLNIITHPSLFRCGILLYTVNFLGDILAAWALYVLLKPVNAHLSLLTAWLRIIYSVLGLVAVMNLLTVLQLSGGQGYLNALSPNQLDTQVVPALHAFRDQWSYAFIFFGIYLLFLGYLAIISGYISRWVGLCLVIAGAGWLVDALQPFLFPKPNVSIGVITGFGELVFML